MNVDRMQTQRFEMKYQVPESVALAVRRYVRPWLEADGFGSTADAPSYPVHSLYLDSGDLSLYQSTINGDRNRFKLRARYYDEKPGSPVYLEIKRRVDRTIHKQRALVRRECAAAIVDGEPPSLHHLVRPDVRNYTALLSFCELMQRLGARTRAHVAYDREAWLSAAHNSVRVTLDRAVRCEPMDRPVFTTSFTQAATVFDRMVVLEIKFTDRFPAWLRDMVHALGLVQSSAAKYVDGVMCCGEARFRAAGVPVLAHGEAGIRQRSRATPPSARAAWPSSTPG